MDGAPWAFQNPKASIDKGGNIQSTTSLGVGPWKIWPGTFQNRQSLGVGRWGGGSNDHYIVDWDGEIQDGAAHHLGGGW